MRKKLPILFLRIGLAFVFLYAGISIVISPDLWIGWVPSGFEKFVDPKIILYLNGIGEIILGLLFLSGKLLKITSLFGAINLLLIVILSGTALLTITFRDVGLFFMAIALFFLA